jgi:hypothetical protein
MGKGDLRHGHAVLLGDLLDGVGYRLVIVGHHPAGDLVCVAAGGLLTPRAGEPALG